MVRPKQSWQYWQYSCIVERLVEILYSMKTFKIRTITINSGLEIPTLKALRIYAFSIHKLKSINRIYLFLKQIDNFPWSTLREQKAARYAVGFTCSFRVHSHFKFISRLRMQLQFVSIGWMGITIAIAEIAAWPSLEPNGNRHRNRVIIVRCEWTLSRYKDGLWVTSLYWHGRCAWTRAVRKTVEFF